MGHIYTVSDFSMAFIRVDGYNHQQSELRGTAGCLEGVEGRLGEVNENQVHRLCQSYECRDQIQW